MRKKKEVKIEEIEKVELPKEEEFQEPKQYQPFEYNYSNASDERTKGLIVVVLFVILAVWIISSADKVKYDSPFNNNGLGNNGEKEEDKEDNATGIIKIYKNIEKLKNDNYEHIYTIETDNEKEYFYLRGQVDKEKSLFYKEYNGKTTTYLKKSSTYYIPGVNAWKKTSKAMSYEGYDILLYDVKSLYDVIYNNEGYTIDDSTGIEKTTVKVDMNKLIELYNKHAEIGKTLDLLEEKTSFVEFVIYTNTDKHLNIEVDLKEYYKLVYNKEYETMFYSLEFYNVGNSTLIGVETMLNNNQE